MKVTRLRLIPVLLLSVLPAFAQAPGGQPLTAMQNYRLGRDLEARNRMTDANVYYNEAIRICQDEVSRNAAIRDTYTVITWAMQRQSRYNDVITWGERGLRVFPGEFRIVETMGEAYFYLGDYNRSLSLMQRYANAMPEGERISTAYFFIGEIHRMARKYRHADIAYTTAVRFEPGLALWWYRLGSVRELAGDAAPAIAAYQEVLKLNPNYREAREGMARLANSGF
ncbi:MAG: tetratricopeptide repeat protein [Treponema sp.]|jgi:tetratricopeptide (TPR) repeat protein|nr:tetratricopeptide repeat protein [Treponema sp.]